VNIVDDGRRLSERNARAYLGFHTVAELRQRVIAGALTPAEVDGEGRMWFRLGELRRYSRDLALLTAAPADRRAA
jgi:hypothetical protein